MSSLLSQIEEIKSSFVEDKAKALKSNDFDTLKNQYLGRKGKISSLFKKISEVPGDKRKEFGEKINVLKKSISLEIDNLNSSNSRLTNRNDDHTDYTLPSTPFTKGRLHPLTIVTNEIKQIFNRIGFSTVTGPEIDSDFYNFEALNIPKDHPARDMQDTFYINSELLLRTHTSSTQIHHMEKNSPPLRIISPGRVYRNEDISVKSYCLFHQIEGLYVDENVSFADLKSTLDYFAKMMFGENVKVRFRPSFFPFTEPSAEMDIYWGLKNESDFKVTKGTGWLEILGCGMVDPNVFKSVKFDSNKWRGYAFGMGIERIAMIKYGISDIRKFYDGNINFLEQFKI
ncbi:phenylalanine--tRNA ligase subunit alpha [Candidatus Marinimicrobia bacterium]|nr:phenylalanine--tRNA ligase subunit alpha [Candidatus Neomarinimicrobiota bacterium]